MFVFDLVYQSFHHQLGSIPYTVGVYVFSTATVTGFPDSSLNVTFAETFIGVAVPTNPSTGVNVTSPVVGSTV